MNHQISNLKALNKFLKVTSVSNKQEEAKAKSSSSGIRDHQSENHIDKLDISQMIYIDDFFFMLGYYSKDSAKEQYIFMTKENLIKDNFRLHSKTLAIKKLIHKETKLIISLGYDLVPDEEGNIPSISAIDVEGHRNKKKLVKVWNYNSLIMGEY